MFLVTDFETRSELELTEYGLHNYATHPTTRALCLGWGLVKNLEDKSPMSLWEPHKGSMPTELLQHLRNPTIDILAFNSAFERYIFKYVLGMDIPVERFQDPQASARYLSLPASLEHVGIALRLPKELRKDKRGKELIQLFCTPHTRTKKQGGGVYFNDWNSHPAEWEEFMQYCVQDCVAELEVARRENLLGAFPLPARERPIWIFDQKVNDRGMPTDKGFVEKLFAMASKNKKEKKDLQNLKTGLENANSRTQLLPWLKDRGYTINNLRKPNIELFLKDPEAKLTDECRDVLTARLEASSTSYKKLETILRHISPDQRLRNQFIFMGSDRCGRWASTASQLHNMARPDGTFEDLDNVRKARGLVYANEYDKLKNAFMLKGKYYSPLIIAKNIIRTVFVPPEGQRFNVCDLNAIETRVGAWVAQCQPLLDVFKNSVENGGDPYLSFAVKMTGIPYDKLYYDLKINPDRVAKALAKLRRQIAKPGVLGAIYRMGGGSWKKDGNGDWYKSGLWGYAESMGIEMTQEEAHEVVRIFRESYPEICGNGFNGEMKGIWIQLEEAVADVLAGERTVRKLGPFDCIEIDKLTIDGRNPILRIKLPSGRRLHYFDAAMVMTKMPWQRKNKETDEMEDVIRPAFTYYGLNQDTHQWVPITSHGGHIFENIVQAIARDVLADKLLEFDQIGLEVVGHVHDEGITLSKDDPFEPGVIEMEAIMDRPVDWAMSLPLGSDGFEDYFYHK
jgi:DNA polymerase